MQTTTHEAVTHLIDVMVAKGVGHAVVSPGSRNAPLLIALAADNRIEKHVILDERSAAYVAVGIAQQSEAPVALVCTSGTALLNYAPAVAEAYYQQLPLIVISADRPTQWIDQNDSQTIRQHGALHAVVKRSFDVQSRFNDATAKWSINRTLNDAVNEALTGRKSPVHINMHFSEPLYETTATTREATRIIDVVTGEKRLGKDQLTAVVKKISHTAKVMIFAAMSRPNGRLDKALTKLSQLENIVVATETIANVSCNDAIGNVYRPLSMAKANGWEEYEPDLLIWFGGAPIMREMKMLMRQSKAEQWRVGDDDCIIDTMQNATMHFAMSPAEFFSQVAEAMTHGTKSEYKAKWLALKSCADKKFAQLINVAPWSDFKALSVVMANVPQKYNLQLSNGTSIRYAQFLPTAVARQDCNRGTSGIDGSTSTALGASMVSENSTLLITGDMSFSYDLAGLASQYNSEKFKIIVLANGGGEIFRMISGPQSVGKEPFEQYFETKTEVPVERYALAFGYQYFEARNEADLQTTLQQFFATNQPAILAVYAPNEVSAQVYKEIINLRKD